MGSHPGYPENETDGILFRDPCASATVAGSRQIFIGSGRRDVVWVEVRVDRRALSIKIWRESPRTVSGTSIIVVNAGRLGSGCSPERSGSASDSGLACPSCALACGQR
jgi:hypothetical protein